MNRIGKADDCGRGAAKGGSWLKSEPSSNSMYFIEGDPGTHHGLSG